jgi:hypothetical protein
VYSSQRFRKGKLANPVRAANGLGALRTGCSQLAPKGRFFRHLVPRATGHLKRDLVRHPTCSLNSRNASMSLGVVHSALRPLGLGSTHTWVSPMAASCGPTVASRWPNATR